MTYQTAAR